MTTKRHTGTRSSKAIIAAGRVGCGCQSRLFFGVIGFTDAVRIRDAMLGWGANHKRTVRNDEIQALFVVSKLQ